MGDELRERQERQLWVEAWRNAEVLDIEFEHVFAPGGRLGLSLRMVDDGLEIVNTEAGVRADVAEALRSGALARADVIVGARCEDTGGTAVEHGAEGSAVDEILVALRSVEHARIVTVRRPAAPPHPTRPAGAGLPPPPPSRPRSARARGGGAARRRRGCLSPDDDDDDGALFPEEQNESQPLCACRYSRLTRCRTSRCCGYSRIFHGPSW